MKIDTNHSIPVIEGRVLTQLQFSGSEIKSISGHQSVQSRAVHLKTKVHQKLQMDSGLFQSFTKNEKEIKIPHHHAILPKPTETLEPLAVPAISIQIPIQQTVATPKIPAVENIDNVDDAIYPSHQNLVMTTFYILIYYLKIVTFRKTKVNFQRRGYPKYKSAT